MLGESLSGGGGGGWGVVNCNCRKNMLFDVGTFELRGPYREEGGEGIDKG
jgi:hypothetical protein